MTPAFVRLCWRSSMSGRVLSVSGPIRSVPFTINYPGTHTFVGEITDANGTAILAVSPSVIVDFAHYIYKLHLELAAKPGTVPVGASTTLTATTAEDIAPSPFETQIYDLTTHTLLAQCYTGITCSATVSQSTATTHLYGAYVAYSVIVDGFEERPDGDVQTAGFVYTTWADTGWTVSLTAGPFSGGNQTFTATASGNVAPTPYYIEIFSVY